MTITFIYKSISPRYIYQLQKSIFEFKIGEGKGIYEPLSYLCTEGYFCKFNVVVSSEGLFIYIYQHLQFIVIITEFPCLIKLLVLLYYKSIN